ncbi:Integrase, catalytic core [Corchorus capsularis]|uniref:Integrase, catalytic core n=1 Tax=Corchorus capsularis TaxID=210143 RepID=A0A1R3H507_COCAP|nr:Integrase, catalytic core [Corchorus capsularis]
MSMACAPRALLSGPRSPVPMCGWVACPTCAGHPCGKLGTPCGLPRTPCAPVLRRLLTCLLALKFNFAALLQTLKNQSYDDKIDSSSSSITIISAPFFIQIVLGKYLWYVKEENVDCTSCKLAKHHALPFDLNPKTCLAPFDLMHTDFWGPSPYETMGGSKYFVIFVDDYSRYTWFYLMKNRSQIPEIVSNFAAMVKAQFSCAIKVLRMDNAMEYRETDLVKCLSQQGPVIQRFCPGTSAQNGQAEHKHRHILDTTRVLLIASKCPERFWGEAAIIAVYTINSVPTPTIGYGIEHKGYRDPISKRLHVFRLVTFLVHKMFSSLSEFQVPNPDVLYFTDPSVELFPETSLDLSHCRNPPTSSSSDALPLPTNESHPSEDPAQDPPPVQELESCHSSPAPLRRSTRVRNPHPRYVDFHCYSTIVSLHEPSNFQEEKSNPLWQQAMAEEIHALEKTHTWDLVDMPPSKSVVDCKWVYKIKTCSDSSIERYKARLVARGFTQEYGIDYEETFAPVAHITSVRTLLAVAAVKRWELFQMDVKNAFLNGDFDEEVYMKHPPGYEHPPNKFGFKSSSYDHALFIRHSEHGSIFLLLYVDDIIITGSDVQGIAKLKNYLSQHFEMKDLGHLTYFLGLEVTSNDSGYFLSQAKYATDFLSRVGLTDAKVTSTPLEANQKLSPLDGKPLDNPTLYRQLVGSLIYLTVTRPDIAHAVHVIANLWLLLGLLTMQLSFTFSYVKGTLFHGLHYSSHSPLKLN